MPNQFTVYKSTDSSAPVLTGQTGKLCDLLDACLVNGYGSKTAAGWAIEFTGTSKRVYRAASGARLRYRIDDAGPGAGTFKEARLTGYETMSDVDTGTGPFPTAAQGVGSVAMQVVRKSAAADATARAWIVVADARTVYVFILTGDSAGVYLAFGFGEFYSLLNSDLYNGMVIGRAAENSATITNDRLDLLSNSLQTANSTWIARGHTGTGGSVNAGRHGDFIKSGNAAALLGATNPVPYTNPSDGGLYLGPVWIHDPTTAPLYGLRGRMRGFWHFMHVIASVTDADTVTGTGDLAGKSFLFIKQTGTAGVYTIETSATLETN